jgi:FAD/FMN-containing dehydrogenase
MDATTEHGARASRLAADLRAARTRGCAVGLSKSTSNLFRARDQAGKARIDARAFNRVLDVDKEWMLVDVEGMTTYETLVAGTLRHGVLPAVVPELKTITIGGAVSGLGIESSSFRYGLVHESVEEMDILLADGRIMTCSRQENPDLFFGIPNSYGTLGYILRLKARVIPARRFVHITHTRFRDFDSFFTEIERVCAAATPDYLDGTVFGREELYVTRGEFVDAAPRASNYTYRHIYYRSIQHKTEDWLTAAGYIWRWDTDWFWCSKQFHLQNPVLRLFATPLALNSRTYQRIMRAAQRWMPDSGGTESVIQDVDIPIAHAPRFLDFLLREVAITPIWICPFRTGEETEEFRLCGLRADRLYVNFGFWDVIPSAYEDGHYNRRIECEAMRLGGKKGLYSRSYYDEDTFWNIYDRRCYDELKAKYDPDGLFPGLYEKCVKRR